MVTLRDNTTTEDIRLDRLVQFDQRSKNYSILPLLFDKKPRSYTWKNTEWYDQRTEGACVAFALGHELNARPAQVKKIPENWLVRGVYWNAQKIDPWEGGSYTGASPTYEGTSVLAGVQTLHKLGAFDEYRWAFNMNDIIMGVGHNGPAVIGVNWYEGMFNPDTNGFIKPTGALGGGHAVMLKGVNVKKEIFTIRNSWGRSWGKDGDCYITFNDLQQLMDNGGECMFMMKRNRNFNNFSY